MDFSKYKKGTTSVWGGESDPFPEGAITPPIVHSGTCGSKDLDDWHSVALGKAKG